MPVVAPAEFAHYHVPPRAGSCGEDAIDLAALAGLDLDSHQRAAIDALCSLRDDGRWAALEGAIIEPRQNGKSAGILLPIALAQAIFVPDQLIVWSAHRYKTAVEAFRAMNVLLGTDDEPTPLGLRVRKRSFANGEESFEFHNGSRIVFVARSGASGRGLSGDLVILDEALFLNAAMMGALFPTLSARPNPLVLYASSAGLAASDILRSIRDRGRAGDDPSLVYLECCADGPDGVCASRDCDHGKAATGCAADDPAQWVKANRAVNAGRMTVDYIAAERRALPVPEFLRERMGWWESPAVGGLFHLPDWWRCQDADSTPGPRVRFAVHVTPDRRFAAVVAASLRGDGQVHAEVVEHREGVAWVVPWLTDRMARHADVDGLVLAGAMAAGSLAPDLEDLRGFAALSSTDVRRACGALFDLVTAGDGLAVMPHDGLDAAVSAASRSSERGEWVFSAAPDFDLSLLYALALAVWSVRGEPDYDVLSSFY